MNEKLLLNKLLKANINKTKSLETLIDEFIKTQTKYTKTQLEEYLSDLFIYINKNFDNIPKAELLDILDSKLKDLNINFDTKSLETIYTKIATTTSVGTTAIVFNEIDVKTIKTMRDGFYWTADKYSSKTQGILKDTIESAFKGDIKRAELGSKLKEKFEGIIDKDENYFELVSDNIISQSQNISTVNQALKYDVEYFKVVAHIDDKTSPFCRAINGRIISAKHLSNQIDNILGAKSIAAKKEAAIWSNKPIYGALPENIGVPPYHGRCRTILEPYWMDDEDMLDEFDRLVNPLQKDIKSKIRNKDKHLKATKYRNEKEMIEATIKNISKEGQHLNDPTKKVIWGQNGCIAFIDKYGDVETCFKPESGISYYEKWAITRYDSLKEKGVKKWLERFLLKF